MANLHELYKLKAKGVLECLQLKVQILVIEKNNRIFIKPLSLSAWASPHIEDIVSRKYHTPCATHQPCNIVWIGLYLFCRVCHFHDFNYSYLVFLYPSQIATLHFLCESYLVER